MASSIYELERLGSGASAMEPLQDGLDTLSKSLANLGELKQKQREATAEQKMVNDTADYFELEGSKGNIPNVSPQNAKPVSDLIRRMGKTTFGSVIGLVTRDGIPKSAKELGTQGLVDLTEYERTGNELLKKSGMAKLTAAIKGITMFKEAEASVADLHKRGGGSGGAGGFSTKGLSSDLANIAKDQHTAETSMAKYNALKPEDQKSKKGQDLLRMADLATKNAAARMQVIDSKEVLRNATIGRAKQSLDKLSDDSINENIEFLRQVNEANED